jgi:ribosomal 30S subunit maturation factor RimM
MSAPLLFVAQVGAAHGVRGEVKIPWRWPTIAT